MEDINVGHYMRTKTLVIQSGTSLKTVIDQLFEHQTSGAPVIAENNLVIGFISEKDCIQKMLMAAYHQDNMPLVDEVMTTDVTCVKPEDNIIDIANMMINATPKIYPVMMDNKYVGVITRQDVLQALVANAKTHPSSQS